MDGDPEELVVIRRWPVWRRVALVLLLLLLVLLLGLWLARAPIASHYVDRELARRGVHATYRIAQIGFGAERLENLVIGNPADPDLTARSVEIRLSWGFRKPRVALIVARGVRLHGRLVNGQVKLGEVDKLLPPPSGLPFRLPDQNVDVADAAVRLDTPGGRIGIGVEGRGNLADGFRGKLAAVGRRLDLGTCRIEGGRAFAAVAVDKLKPHFTGPLTLGSAACGTSFALRGGRFDLDATLAPALNGWTGNSSIAVAGLRSGGSAMTGISGHLDFDGNAVRTRGGVTLAAAAAKASDFAAARTGMSGNYDLAPKDGRYAFSGDVRASGVRGGEAHLAPLLTALSSAHATPIGPVTDAWAAALGRALRSGLDAAGSVSVQAGTGGGALRVARLSAVSGSGVRLAFDGEGVAYSWPAGTTRIDGDFSLVGGGLPHARFSLSQAGPGQPVRGVGRIAPYRAGNASLALDAIRFAAAPDGATTIRTVAKIDGPFGGGTVSGLVLPIDARIDGRGGFALGEGCTTASFAALREGSLRLGPIRLPLCPTGRALVWKAPGGALQGGASLRGARLAGRLGSSPVAITARTFNLSLNGPAFTGSGVAIRLGAGDRISQLDIATLSGRVSKAGVAGLYEGVSGKLAAVPLLLDQGKGRWDFSRGVLHLAGAVRVADATNPPRFYPLVSDDFRLTLADDRIAAVGWLKEPKSGARIAEAHIAHNLATGTGRATLDMPGITFDEHFQPEQLTRLTTGVVALVRGTVKGAAEIGWSAKGTTSTGTFSTENMNLAASFGPVEGLTTSLHFTDLLGLVSAPGQIAETKVIHTGIDVFDGRIRYRLLPNLRVEVEGASWPFAGGELTLDETILDFSKPSAKRLTFHVTGMDGARFIQQMEFSNISGTGTFDGVVPMIFDERGGRIVGGRLEARPGGGTLSYVGELTDKQLGAYGKLAFDALKSLRYSRLNVSLDGSLDGEFVAGIKLDGIARDPSVAAAPGGGISGMVVGRALSQLAKIPFRFNINVRGPFRAILGTARSLQDPTNLIQSVLPQMLRDKPTTTTVQPHESETVP